MSRKQYEQIVRTSAVSFRGRSSSGDQTKHYVFLYREITNSEWNVCYISRVLTTHPKDYGKKYKVIKETKIKNRKYYLIENENCLLLNTLIALTNSSRFLQLQEERKYLSIMAENAFGEQQREMIHNMILENESQTNIIKNEMFGQ